MSQAFRLSQRAEQTEDQPISYFMQQAVENPELISLAAGLVDPESLPADDVRLALDEILADPRSAQAALQYGTTQGYAPLRERILAHVLALDGVTADDVSLSVDDIVITSGSQQLLYLVGELLLDPGDIVITEAPSYFVYHGVLSSLGLRMLSVPMDEHGMDTDALAELLARLERSGELERVRLIYTVDYYQNPTGLTLSLPRRQHLLELARRYSKKQRLFVLEDAAYRELRFAGPDFPSIKSFDTANEHVILAMTFSKPAAPGLKTGYGVLPRDLVGALGPLQGQSRFRFEQSQPAHPRAAHGIGRLRPACRPSRGGLSPQARCAARRAGGGVPRVERRALDESRRRAVRLAAHAAGGRDGTGQPFHASGAGAGGAVRAGCVLLREGRARRGAEP